MFTQVNLAQMVCLKKHIFFILAQMGDAQYDRYKILDLRYLILCLANNRIKYTQIFTCSLKFKVGTILVNYNNS